MGSNKPDLWIERVTPGGNMFSLCVAEMLCPQCGVYAQATGPVISGAYAAIVCKRCGQVVMIQANSDFSSQLAIYNVIDQYPKKTASVDPSVPNDIAADYLEAYRCFSVGAWHGCAVLARRVVHQIMDHCSAQGASLKALSGVN